MSNASIVASAIAWDNAYTVVGSLAAVGRIMRAARYVLIVCQVDGTYLEIDTTLYDAPMLTGALSVELSPRFVALFEVYLNGKLVYPPIFIFRQLGDDRVTVDYPTECVAAFLQDQSVAPLPAN